MPVPSSVRSRTPNIISAPMPAAAATETQAARVKERIRPTVRTVNATVRPSLPMPDRPGLSSRASEGNQNMASTAP